MHNCSPVGHGLSHYVQDSQPTRMSVSSSKKPRASITAVAWVPQGDMDLAEWSRAAQRLGAIDRCSPWWIGDCIRYGNTRFGEKYRRAAKITGYDVKTLMNRVYVASHIEVSRRRETLSWSHHEAIVSLPLDEQDYWLDVAIKHKMSVADLRLELRVRRARTDDGSKHGRSDCEDEAPVPIACPNCGQLIPLEIVAGVSKELTAAAIRQV